MARTSFSDYRRIADALGIPSDAITETGKINATAMAVSGVINAVKQ
jgi:hypothetical protein